MSRLTEIKAMKARGVTVFADWERHVDWLIDQVSKHDGVPEGKFPGCDKELRVLRVKVEEYKRKLYIIEQAVKS